MIINHILV